MFDFLYSAQFYEIVFILVVGYLVYIYFFGTEAIAFRDDRAECEKSTVVFEGYNVDRPDGWKYKFPLAGGKEQSPVSLREEATVPLNPGDFTTLKFNDQYFSVPKSMTLLNDGFGVLLGTCFEKEYPTISGGPLKMPYRFNLAQFKWGPTNTEGSEHIINSKRFAMEMQLMHIQGEKVYENLDTAVKQGAVMFISFLFAVLECFSVALGFIIYAHSLQVTVLDNPYLSPMVDKLSCIRLPNTSYTLDPFPLCWLFQPFKSNYYFYRGSITCPPCTEGAEWIVQSEPLSISNNQLQAFRSLMAVDGPMRRNVRPVQKLFHRTVFYYA